MKSIVLILPYFGKLPNFFNIWLQSAINNSSIDFLIFTDCIIDYPISDNIKIVPITFLEFKNKCQKYVDEVIALETPYKLCDYRPLYGKILSDYTKNYDFWGFVDCDTVLGNIRKFLTDELLNKYNHLLCLGHLQLQKVEDPFYDDILSHIQAQGKYNLKYVYSHPENFCVDELPYGLPLTYWNIHPEFFYCEYHPEGRPLYDELTPNYKQFVDLYNDKVYLGRFYHYHFYGIYEHEVPFWKRSEGNNYLRRMLHYKYRNGSLIRCYWRGIKYQEEEILYIHLYRRKMVVRTNNYNDYCIFPHEFYGNSSQDNIFRAWMKTRPRIFSQFRLYWRREIKKLLR